MLFRSERWSASQVMLEPEETHHLARVLRLPVGSRVAVCDGRGRVAAAAVIAFREGQAVLALGEDLPGGTESPLRLTLGLGLAKGEVMDQVVRQAAEMGLSRFIPFSSTYAEKISPERADRRLARWRRQVRESLKSSLRTVLPEFSPVQDFAQVLEGPEEVKLLCYEGEAKEGLRAPAAGERVGAVRLLVGPEGGFTPEEVRQAREAGFRIVSLGPRRLRVETAALAALALVQYLWGDLA